MLLSQLIEILKTKTSSIKEYEIKNNRKIESCGSLLDAQIGQITFIETKNKLFNKLSETRATAIIIPDIQDIVNIVKTKGISYIISTDPRLLFAITLNIINNQSKKDRIIDKDASISKTSIIGSNCYIGPNVFIGENTSIGENNIIYPNAVISDDVKIGDNNIIYSNCVINNNSIINNNCIFHPNCVIGSDGFGFVPTKKGWYKMPQTGNVLIKNNVEIGSNSCVDKPTVGSTIIGEGTKIDNLVQIGHGVIVGKNCAFASQVGIAGGAIIGDNVILAGQVGVNNRVKVGNGVIASSKCGIHADIKDGEIISGFPAISNKLWLRCSSYFKKLPELNKLIRDLNKE
tara:strand:- start:11462 stop:12496 length:1035 start_codon:yes stop_codon:yes gene_type:complete